MEARDQSPTLYCDTPPTSQAVVYPLPIIFTLSNHSDLCVQSLVITPGAQLILRLRLLNLIQVDGSGQAGWSGWARRGRAIIQRDWIISCPIFQQQNWMSHRESHATVAIQCV